MRLVVQRVTRAGVSVDGRVVASIGAGMLVLLGVEKGDTEAEARKLAGRVARFRFFADDAGRMNRSIVDVGGEALVVSQVTLARQPRKGNRPGFDRAALPAEGERLYGTFLEALAAAGVDRIERGVFGAMMAVDLVNDGPVTFVFEADPDGR